MKTDLQKFINKILKIKLKILKRLKLIEHIFEVLPKRINDIDGWGPHFHKEMKEKLMLSFMSSNPRWHDLPLLYGLLFLANLVKYGEKNLIKNKNKHLRDI